MLALLEKKNGGRLDLTDMLTTAATTHLDETTGPKSAAAAAASRAADPFEAECDGSIPIPVTAAAGENDLSEFRPPDVTVRRVWPYDLPAQPLDEELWLHSFTKVPKQIAKIFRGRKPRHEQQHATVIVLDWDDTLFASTWMHLIQRDLWRRTFEELDRQWNAQLQWPQLYDKRRFTPMDHKHLLQLEESSLTLLKTCSAYGSVIIVTNAEPGWVELSGSKFMPKVMQYIEQKSIQIISARATFAQTYPTAASFDGEPDAWKVNAFSLLINKILRDVKKKRVRSGSSSSVDRHCDPRGSGEVVVLPQHSRIGSTADAKSKQFTLLSIGDSECERRALLQCRQKFYPSGYFKSVKLVENPHPALLKRQLDYLKNVVPKILDLPDSVDLVFEPPPPRLARTTSSSAAAASSSS